MQAEFDSIGRTPFAASRYQLIAESKVVTQRLAQKLKEMIGALTGPGYDPSIAQKDTQDENYHFHYSAGACARNLMGLPKVHLASDIDEASPKIAQLEDGLNRWTLDTDYASDSEQWLMDMCFGFAISAASREPRPGYEQNDDPLQTPRLRRVPPGVFGWDIAAPHWKDCAFLYHAVIRKKVKLETVAANGQEDGWNLEAVRALSAEHGVKDLRDKQTIARGEVVYFEYWDVDDLEDDHSAWDEIPKDQRKLYHGTLWTIGWGGETPGDRGAALQLREPRPWFGPRGGPYVVGGFLTVPDRVEPLSNLLANEEQLRQVNRQCRANDRAAERAKSVAIVDSTQEQLARALIDANDTDFLAIPGYEKGHAETIVVSTLTPDKVERELYLRERADRAVGTSDAHRGQAQRGVTATADVEASRAASTLESLCDFKFDQFRARGIKQMSWYFWHDDASVTRSGGSFFIGGAAKDHEAAIERAHKQGFLSDAHAALAMSMPPTPDDDDSFDDLECRIETVKLGPEETQNFVAGANMALQWAPIFASAPQIVSVMPGLPAMFKQAAEQLKQPWLRHLMDPQAAMQLAQQIQDQQEAAQAATQQPNTIPPPKSPSPPAIGAAGKAAGPKPQLQSMSK